jgi:hypothetical protein
MVLNSYIFVPVAKVKQAQKMATAFFPTWNNHGTIIIQLSATKLMIQLTY